MGTRIDHYEYMKDGDLGFLGQFYKVTCLLCGDVQVRNWRPKKGELCERCEKRPVLCRTCGWYYWKLKPNTEVNCVKCGQPYHLHKDPKDRYQGRIREEDKITQEK